MIKIIIKNKRAIELNTINPIKIPIFDVIMIIGIRYKITHRIFVVERLLFNDWVIPTEKNSWIKAMVEDQITIAIKCRLFGWGDTSIAFEKLDFDLYLSIELSDMIHASSDEVKIKFPIEDQCR